MDQFHEVGGIRNEIIEMLAIDAEGKTHNISLPFSRFDLDALMQIIRQVKNVAIPDLLGFLEALGRLFLVGLVIRFQPADEFAVVEVGNLVVNACLKDAIVVRIQQTETVRKIKITLVELDPMTSFIVEALQFLGDLNIGVFLLLLDGYIVIADTQVPLINDCFQRFIN